MGGCIAKNVDAYCRKNPEASFEEVEARFFPGQDNYIHLFALSPRHFECAMTETCQVLVEGDYSGVFEPGVDYIEIKKDFSNIPEVIEKIKDVDYCEQIAKNCYRHVVESGKYTYEGFVNTIINIIKKETTIQEVNVVSNSFVELCKCSQIIPTLGIRDVFITIKILGINGGIRQIGKSLFSFLWESTAPLHDTLIFKIVRSLYHQIRR